MPSPLALGLDRRTLAAVAAKIYGVAAGRAVRNYISAVEPLLLGRGLNTFIRLVFMGGGGLLVFMGGGGLRERWRRKCRRSDGDGCHEYLHCGFPPLLQLPFNNASLGIRLHLQFSFTRETR
jgi:hypothetical protein